MKKETNKWPLSFGLAVALHLLFLVGGSFAFIQAPDYGIQGSAASIDVYMVAARPQLVKESIPSPQQPIVQTTSPGDMAVAQTKSKMKETPRESQKSKGKGDGSSEKPGQSVTTLFAVASSEIAGKAGEFQNPPPQYPELALRNHWQGVVVLKVEVASNGKPGKVLVDEKSGHRILDEAAVSAVKKWQFTPGRLGNIAVSTWIRIPIRFEIEKA